jgi:hypothetical protein
LALCCKLLLAQPITLCEQVVSVRLGRACTAQQQSAPAPESDTQQREWVLNVCRKHMSCFGITKSAAQQMQMLNLPLHLACRSSL